MEEDEYLWHLVDEFSSGSSGIGSAELSAWTSPNPGNRFGEASIQILSRCRRSLPSLSKLFKRKSQIVTASPVVTPADLTDWKKDEEDGQFCNCMLGLMERTGKYEYLDFKREPRDQDLSVQTSSDTETDDLYAQSNEYVEQRRSTLLGRLKKLSRRLTRYL